jgi:hypothetical protein
MNNVASGDNFSVENLLPEATLLVEDLTNQQEERDFESFYMHLTIIK